MPAGPGETVYTGDLEGLAGLISWRVTAWQDFSHENPHGPDRAAIPPTGERAAAAAAAARDAIEDIDRLITRLHQIHTQLVSELRQDEDTRRPPER